MDKSEKLGNLRHTLAHLLAASVGEIYKFDNIKLTLGPSVDNGFYYDIDFCGTKVADADLKKIEDVMRKKLPKWTEWEHKEITKDEAIKFFKNEYKIELINEIAARGEKITTYTCGGFTDLCRGGHLENPGKEIDPDSFKLDRVAGAYWRGDEKNKMLTRIYGLAFETKEELDAYITQQTEAEKRDHRKLGKELDLFVFSDLVGKGLPLLTPKGTVIRKELERFVYDTETKWGYQHVITPPLAKVELYEKSGHYPYYKNTMYPVMQVDEDQLILRPMTCPHHFMLYKSKPHSYRELPLRIAELSPQFRYEKSGELTGLMRVRMFCLADAHIIATREQAKSEIKKVLDLIDYVNEIFGLKKGVDYRYRLSLGDKNDSEKYYKDDDAWNEAEEVLRSVLKETKAPFFEAEGEAAFYGPKIDIQMKKVSGQEETAFTVQYDFVMPKRFDLTYTDEKGKEQQPIVIHRSSIGAFERTMAFLIERYAGAFPLWLSPVQVKVIPVRTSHNEYARQVFELLKENNIRAEFDDAEANLGGKVRDAKNQKMPYWIVIGDKEIEADKVTLESRDKGPLGQTTKEELLKKLLEEIRDKK